MRKSLLAVLLLEILVVGTVKMMDWRTRLSEVQLAQKGVPQQPRQVQLAEPSFPVLPPLPSRPTE